MLQGIANQREHAFASESRLEPGTATSRDNVPTCLEISSLRSPHFSTYFARSRSWGCVAPHTSHERTQQRFEAAAGAAGGTSKWLDENDVDPKKPMTYGPE